MDCLLSLGYGLKLDTEMKMLKVLHQAETIKEEGTILPDIVSTYLAAHAVPIGTTSQEATDDIINNQVLINHFL